MAGGGKYEVVIRLKDANGVLQKLESINGGGKGGKGGSSTTASSGSAGGPGGIMAKMEGLGVGQLLKLAGIAGGVATLVGLTIKSSGALQGVFKLWETSMLLIFKPIGDFFAYALRPLTLMLLMWAIPFYKIAAPVMRDLGKWVGGQLTNIFRTDGGIAGDQVRSSIDFIGKSIDTSKIMLWWSTFLADLTIKTSQFPNALWGTLVAFADSIWTKLSSLPAIFWGYFISFIDTVWARLSSLPAIFWGYLVAVGTNIYQGLIGIPKTLAEVFTGLAGDIGTALGGIPKAIYDAIMAVVSRISGGLLGGSTAGSNGPAPQLASRFGNATRMAGLASAVTS